MTYKKIQNMSCRIILKTCNMDSVTDMRKTLELLKLNDRRDLHLSQACHMAIYEPNRKLKEYFNRVLNHRNTGRISRHSNEMNMKTPTIRSTKGRSAFSFHGPKHWNGIPNDIKIIINIIASKTNWPIS